MSKVKKVEELTPVEINRDITKVVNIIKKPGYTPMRSIGTPGKQVVIEGRAGYINHIKDGFVFVEMLDGPPGNIEKFDFKTAVKGYKSEKEKAPVANTAVVGPVNATYGKAPGVDKSVVGLKMESFSGVKINEDDEFEEDFDGGLLDERLNTIIAEELSSILNQKYPDLNEDDVLDILNDTHEKIVHNILDMLDKANWMMAVQNIRSRRNSHSAVMMEQDKEPIEGSELEDDMMMGKLSNDVEETPGREVIDPQK